MADSGLYLLDVTIKPGAYIKDVISGSWKMMHTEGCGKIIYGFKVALLRCIQFSDITNSDVVGCW